MIRHSSLVALTFAIAMCAGCIASSAGTLEARNILSARLGATTASDDAAVDREMSALLAKPLTADSAVKIALLRSPDVRAAFDRIGVARGELVSAARPPNPTLEGDLRFRGARTDPDVDVGGVIDVRDFILLPLRKKSATDDLDAASIEAAGLTMDVALHAREEYVDYLAARQLLDLEKTVLEAADASAELARQLREAGNIPEAAMLGDQAFYNEIRLDYAQAESDLVAARARLNLRLGLSGKEGDAWEAADRLADPPDEELSLDEVENRSIAASLDLAELRARYAAAAGRANLAVTSGVLPALNVGVIAERDLEGWGVGPQVGIGIPLFYQGEGESMTARAEMKLAESISLATAAEIRTRAKTLALEFTTARERALHYKSTVLPLRQKILDETQLQYNAMAVSGFQLLDAKRDQVQSAAAYIGALRTYWSTRGELEMLLAGRMADEAIQGMNLSWQTLRSREMPHR